MRVRVRFSAWFAAAHPMIPYESGTFICTVQRISLWRGPSMIASALLAINVDYPDIAAVDVQQCDAVALRTSRAGTACCCWIR
jgi:hypothetical protein